MPERTSSSAMAAASRFCWSLNFAPIASSDSSGFVLKASLVAVNRIHDGVVNSDCNLLATQCQLSVQPVSESGNQLCSEYF
jgi:hypothetical protein